MMLNDVSRPARTDSCDVVVIGGGAAGLSAALVLARARRSVLVIDSGSPRNAAAEHMQGFLSRDGLAPQALLAAGRAEIRTYGADAVQASVDHLVGTVSSGFTLLLDDDRRVTARRLLVATGLRDHLPDVPGLRVRWARDVLHCPYCHGFEVRDQQLGVLWNGPETVRYAQVVRQWTHDVVLFAPRGRLTHADRTELVARAIGIVEGDVVRLLLQDDRLRALELDDGSEVPRDALFVPPTFVPNNDLLLGLGCDVTPQGFVVTGPNGLTSVAGVWAAGNVANPRAQVITAAGEGSAAAIAINADLVDEDVRVAVRDFNRGHIVNA
jgi:thioredoxin reductase